MRERYGDPTALIKMGDKYAYDWGDPKQTLEEITEVNAYRYDMFAYPFTDLQLFNSGLICSSKDKGKLVYGYSSKDLILDLATVFNYIPKVEIKRFVILTIWMLREALKMKGKVTLENFGTLSVRQKKVPRIFCVADKHAIVQKAIYFSMSDELASLIRPMNPYVVPFSHMINPKFLYRTAAGTLFYHKLHYNTGHILLSQKPFEPGTFHYLGYSPEFKEYENNNQSVTKDNFKLPPEEGAYLKEMYYDYQPDLWRWVTTLTRYQPEESRPKEEFTEERYNAHIKAEYERIFRPNT